MFAASTYAVGNFGLPYRTLVEIGTVKGVIDPIFVGYPDKVMHASTDGGPEKRWCRSKISIAYLLIRGHLPGIYIGQICSM